MSSDESGVTGSPAPAPTSQDKAVGHQIKRIELEDKMKELTSEDSTSDAGISEWVGTIAVAEKEHQDATSNHARRSEGLADREMKLTQDIDALRRARGALAQGTHKHRGAHGGTRTHTHKSACMRAGCGRTCVCSTCGIIGCTTPTLTGLRRCGHTRAHGAHGCARVARAP